MQLETRALGVLVSSYCCSSYRAAEPFSSLGAFSRSFIGGPAFHPIDDCEHPLLYLAVTGIASYETVIPGSLQQNLAGICNSVWVLWLIMGLYLSSCTYFSSFAFQMLSQKSHRPSPPLPYPPTPTSWPWRSPVLGHIKFASPMGLSLQ